MNAAIRFNLDDSDDRMAHMRCIKSLNMALALFNIQEMLFKNDVITMQQFNEILWDKSIYIDEIIN